ncbi:unnamed protein product, partial [Vitrella brassicaformis CCMP3155]
QGCPEQMAASSSASQGSLPPGWLAPRETIVSCCRSQLELTEAIIHRTLTGPEQVAGLIQRGADPNTEPLMRKHKRKAQRFTCWKSSGGRPRAKSCLALAIDNKTSHAIPTVWTTLVDCMCLLHPVALPRWASPQLEEAIINALINGGADINGGGVDFWTENPPPLDPENKPIKVAISGGNEAAVNILMQRQVNLRGLMVLELPGGDGVYSHPPGPDYEKKLLSFFRRLLQHDSTLATETDRFGHNNLLHHAAENGVWYSQAFIDAYIELLVGHGADMTAVAGTSSATPLHCAAECASHRVAESLCRRLSADDINRGTANEPNNTPLAAAARQLPSYNLELENVDDELDDERDGGEDDDDDDDDDSDEELDPAEEERIRTRAIPNIKATIRTLLRGGADITRLPMATEEQRRQRQFVLAEYATVLNELSEAVMSAINAALAPQRDHSTLLARLLPLAPHHDGAHPHPSPSNMAFGPHEAEGIGWKIAAFCFDWDDAAMAIGEKIGLRNSTLARRVRAAIDHFVKSALYASSNREVVGGTRYQQQGDKRVKVTVPPLQCFATRAAGNGGQVVGVREVVHRARLDEVAKYQLTGVEKGFNAHLGNEDCQFGWGQLELGVE